jgi:hypothetical protein
MDETHLGSLLVVVLSRATERILLVLVGALAVYLGYSLFLHIPTANRSEGKIDLPGGVSIFLTRIGPGVFFALFGVAVIGYSVTRPIQFTLPTVASASAPVVFSGLGEANTPKPAVASPLSVSGLTPDVVVARLNGLLEIGKQSLGGPAAAEFGAAVRSAKFAVMLVGWKPEWGDREKFAGWVRDHGDSDPPPGLVPGATVVFGTVLQ